MSAAQITNLIKMANQIALNLAVPADAAEDNAALTKATSHIQSFWTTAMIEEIKAYTTQGGEELSDAASRVINRL